MAIDYSGYAQNYGGDRQAGAAIGQALGTGIGMIPGFKERYAKNETSAIKSYTNPLMNAMVKNIDEIDLSGFKNASQAFADYSNNMLGSKDDPNTPNIDESTKGTFMGRKAKRKGLINSRTFIDKYNQDVAMLAPGIMKKMLKKQTLGKLDDYEMRKWVASRPGLAGFILENVPGGPEGDKFRNWATPQKTLGEKWEDIYNRFSRTDEYSPLQSVLYPAMGIGTGVLAYKGAKKLINRYKGKAPLTGPVTSRPGVTPTSRQIPPVQPRQLGGKPGSKGYADAARLGSKRQPLMSATNVKNINKNTSPTQVKKLTKMGINDIPKMVKSSMTKISNFRAKHGTSALIKAIIKKAGPKQAFKLLTKVGISGLLTGSGAMTAVGIGFGALTLWDIASMLSDVDE
tara:strand:- start:345 stop:1544 length:1200 start_codon:yes stop_codon:yes gene_type:complete